MEPIKSNNLGSRKVDLGFWKFMKKKACDEQISLLELQRRIAKANNITLKEPKYKLRENPKRFKFEF